MSKTKTAFFCQQCGYESVKWVGQCPSCEQWNSFVEEVIEKDTTILLPIVGRIIMRKNDQPRQLHIHSISSKEEKRMVTSDGELNRVLGGGIVPGSIILVAGEPGIGKSTLFLQNGLLLKKGNCPLYKWRRK